MQALLADNLHRLARRYAAGHGLTIGTVGRKVAGDHRFFPSVASGAVSFTAAKFDAVVCAMAENWPASQDWPSDIPWPGERVAVTPAEHSPHRFAAPGSPVAAGQAAQIVSALAGSRRLALVSAAGPVCPAVPAASPDSPCRTSGFSSEGFA